MKKAILFVWVLMVSTVLAGPIPGLKKRTDFLRRKYSSLYSLKVQSLPDGTKKFHNGTLFMREGLRILSLKGDRFEMAFQHGRLLQKEIPDGVISIASKMIQNQVNNALGDKPVIAKFATNYINKHITDKIVEWTASSDPQTGAQSLDDAIALSETTGIDVETLVRALFAPEALMILAHMTVEKGSEFRVGTSFANCTDFIAWNSLTRNGELLIGRNTDFQVHGYFDKYPTVIYFEPTDGDQRYMSVVSAGMHNAGLVSYNESGIYLSAHTVPSNQVSTDGVPTFVTVTQTIRRAKTFDEAVALMRQNLPPTGWAYAIVSTKERRAATLELSNQGSALRESTAGLHIQTNFYQTPEMKDAYESMNRAIDEDSTSRYHRASALVTQTAPLDPMAAIKILGDSVDPMTGDTVSFPNTIGVHTTITSAVLLPESGKMFVSNGKAPLVPRSKFIELPLVDRFSPSTFQTEPYSILDNTEQAEANPSITAALKDFLTAKMIFEFENDVAKSLSSLRKAIKSEPTNPALWFVAGIMSSRLGNFSTALADFTQTGAMAKTAHRKHLAAYYRARALAQLQRHDEAIQALEALLREKGLYPRLELAAQENLALLQTGKKVPLTLKSLKILFQQADTLAY